VKVAIETRFTNQDYFVFGATDLYDNFIKLLTNHSIHRLIDTNGYSGVLLDFYGPIYLYITGLPTARRDNIDTPIRYNLFIQADGEDLSTFERIFAFLVNFFLSSANMKELGHAPLTENIEQHEIGSRLYSFLSEKILAFTAKLDKVFHIGVHGDVQGEFKVSKVNFSDLSFSKAQAKKIEDAMQDLTLPDPILPGYHSYCLSPSFDLLIYTRLYKELDDFSISILTQAFSTRFIQHSGKVVEKEKKNKILILSALTLILLLSTASFWDENFYLNYLDRWVSNFERLKIFIMSFFSRSVFFLGHLMSVIIFLI